MNIITGYCGEPHITSEQDRGCNQGAFGTGSYVLNVGNKLAATIASNNEIQIADGVLSHQGCTAIIEAGTYDSVSISNGAQGMNRIDRIVARYTKDPDTNIESMSLVVITGTATSSTPSAPSYTTGNIQTGSLTVDMPLYNVRLTGVAITSCTAQFTTLRTQAEKDTLLGSTSISGIGNGTVTGAISTLNSNLNTSTIDSVDSTSKTIAAGSTDWLSVNKNSSWKGSTLVGYYVSGTGNSSINVYAFYQTSSGASAAVRNTGSSSATVTITFYFRHY